MFYDIYPYTLCYYMLSSWRMYEMHLALFLKAGCDSQAGSGEQAALGTSTAVYGYNSPDCPVVHRTVWWAVHRRTRRSREFTGDVRL
jgi:hypothetical protein